MNEPEPPLLEVYQSNLAQRIDRDRTPCPEDWPDDQPHPDYRPALSHVMDLLEAKAGPWSKITAARTSTPVSCGSRSRTPGSRPGLCSPNSAATTGKRNHCGWIVADTIHSPDATPVPGSKAHKRPGTAFLPVLTGIRPAAAARPSESSAAKPAASTAADPQPNRRPNTPGPATPILNRRPAPPPWP